MRRLVFALTLLTGLSLALLAVFAQHAGLDRDAAWGGSRYLLFFSGLALIAPGLAVRGYQSPYFPAALRQRLRRAAAASAQAARQIAAARWISLGLALILLAAVNLYALWFGSDGRFPAFTRVGNYYGDLGEAFLHGQLALLEQPDPRLAALADPVNQFEQRHQLPYPWDISYYKGQYYVYWGPAPALVYAGAQLLTGTRPPDQLGPLLSFAGVSVLMLALLTLSQRRLYPRAPGLSLVIFLAAAMLNLPNLFLLARGNVYETAVIAGQFGLLLGLLGWLQFLHHRRSRWLWLSGLGCALAVGARYNLALAVGVLLALALLEFWQESRLQRRFWQRSAALLTPLVICGLALGLYNLARFDHPLETGLRFQLSHPDWQQEYFAAHFLPANLYAYLFYPPSFQDHFPFVASVPFQPERFPAWAAIPPRKTFEEVMVGAFYSLPVLWLALIAGLFGLGVWARRRMGRRAVVEGEAPGPGAVQAQRVYLLAMVSLGALAQFGFLLFYYYGAMRFYADFSFLAVLGLAFSAWTLDESLTRWRGWAAGTLRFAFWLIAAGLVLITVTSSLLGGFDIPPQTFRQANPHAFAAVADLANRVYTPLAALPESPGLIGAVLRLILRLVS